MENLSTTSEYYHNFASSPQPEPPDNRSETPVTRLCKRELAWPAVVPLLVAVGIATVILLVVLGCYWIRECRLRKTFYGVTDEMDEPVPVNEVKIIQSMESVNRPNELGTTVKVIMRRRKPNSKSVTDLLVPAERRRVRSPLNTAIDYTVALGLQPLAADVVASLTPLVEQELYRASQHRPGTPELEIHIAELIVSEMRARLEQLTFNNLWVCHGRLANHPNWVVNGHENLLEKPGDLLLELRIDVKRPVEMVLLGHRIQSKGKSKSASATPLPHNSSAGVVTPGCATTQPLTLTPTTPVIKSANSSGPGQRVVTTAEPLNPLATPGVHPPSATTPVPPKAASASTPRPAMTLVTPVARTPRRTSLMGTAAPAATPTKTQMPPTNGGGRTSATNSADKKRKRSLDDTQTKST